MKTEGPGINITIYIPDGSLYRDLQSDLKVLWFRNYKESLSKGLLIIRALSFLKEYLEGDIDVSSTKEPTSLKNFIVR